MASAFRSARFFWQKFPDDDGQVCDEADDDAEDGDEDNHDAEFEHDLIHRPATATLASP